MARTNDVVLDELDELAPLPEDDQDHGGEWLAALVLLLLLLGANAGRPLSLSRRIRARTLLRGNFDTSMGNLAVQVANGSITVEVWQQRMSSAIAAYARQMAVAGAGQLPSTATRQWVAQQVAAQQPYLRRFAAAIAQRQQAGNPLSPAYIANRARQYGGSGWGAFYAAQGANAAPGYVEQWITRDDKAVCRVCAPRHLRYFLPGSPPFPGTDCLGTCRCERLPVYDPVEYAKLV